MKLKIITLVVVSAFVLSCSTNKYVEKTIPGTNSIAFIDFKTFLDKGFIFSTGDINQTYVPLGILYFTAEPDIVSIYRPFNSVVMESMKSDGRIIVDNNQEYLLIGSTPKQKGNLNELLQKVYEYSVSKGANGVIGLKYNTLPNSSIEITGTLIKLAK